MKKHQSTPNQPPSPTLIAQLGRRCPDDPTMNFLIRKHSTRIWVLATLHHHGRITWWT